MEVKRSLSDKAIRDNKIIQDALETGNPKAYARLLKYYWDPVYFMIFKMTGNESDADDLTIEAFTKAFKNLHQFTSDFAFSTWLYKIAVNHSIDHFRKKNQNNFPSDTNAGHKNLNPIPEDIPSQNPDPEEILINKQKINLIREVVERLKPHYRTLIELRYFNELSYDEISKQMQLPLGTVKVQLFRAKELLYNILKTSQEKI